MRAAVAIASILLVAQLSSYEDDWRTIDALESPMAFERADAANTLRQRWTEREYIRLYRENRNAFWELSAAGLPDGRSLESSLLSSDSHALAADALLRAGRYALMDGEGPVVENMRKMWVDGWFGRARWDICNGELLRYIASRKWLREMLYGDRRLRRFAEIVSILSGDMAFGAPDNTFLVWLDRCVRSGKNELLLAPMTGGYNHFFGLASTVHSRFFWSVSHAEIICILLDRPEWILEISPRLRESTITISVWNGAEFVLRNATSDRRNRLVRLAALSATLSIETLKTEMLAYVRAGVGAPVVNGVLGGHDWFDIATTDDEFLKFYEENIKPVRPMPEADRLKISEF